jgi:hypothetical protein
MEMFTMKLLNTDGGNTKIAKSMKSKLGTDLIRIASLSMMPDDVLCPSRHIAGCADTCLRSTGRGVFQNVIDSRQRKTDWWHADRDGFLVQLRKEMHSFIRACKRQGVKPVFRLNTISDIQWERFLDLEGEFGDAFFYDYTKLGARLHKKMPSNYKLMFSFSARAEYAQQVALALGTDVPIAVVFKGQLPEVFLGRKVIDGDASDIANVQAGEVVIGLRAKGKAKRDTKGFAVDASNLIAVA